MNTPVHCPECKSTQISANKKGFSGKQAVGGAVLTGGVGLLAGTINSNKVIITCLSCGHTFKPGEQSAMQKRAQKRKQEKEMIKSKGFWIFLAVMALMVILLASCSKENDPVAENGTNTTTTKSCRIVSSYTYDGNGKQTGSGKYYYTGSRLDSMVGFDAAGVKSMSTNYTYLSDVERTSTNTVNGKLQPGHAWERIDANGNSTELKMFDGSGTLTLRAETQYTCD